MCFSRPFCSASALVDQLYVLTTRIIINYLLVGYCWQNLVHTFNVGCINFYAALFCFMSYFCKGVQSY